MHNKADIFNQIHIDVARNATDDFNLFHDGKKWSQIRQNPYGGPIVLGFQLESLLAHKILLHRQFHDEDRIIAEKNLNFSNYQFSFVNAVKPGQTVSIEIKESHLTEEQNPVLKNRVLVKADGKLALLGYKIESSSPLFSEPPDLSQFQPLQQYTDRSYLANSAYFLKRKFINISNAKNLLCGSLVDQDDYFDDIKAKAIFPEIFPCSFISCALLEKAWQEKHDFEQNPMVYMAHKISINRDLAARLQSNDVLHILVRQITTITDPLTDKENQDGLNLYECFGLVKNDSILYSALIWLAPLETVIKSMR